MRELCLPAGLDSVTLGQIDQQVKRRHPVKRGDYLYRAGGELHYLYAIRIGFMKSCVVREDGREEVAGFHMMGDMIALDAIGANRHVCDAIALEDSEVCEIPIDGLERLAHNIPALQQHFHRIMNREIARDYGIMLLLDSMRAEERLAAFLLNLSQRFAARGYSAFEFNLRMTREEIGSYLGLTLETISRVLSRFQEQDLVEVQNKLIRIINMENLRTLLDQHTCQPGSTA